jgi:hypothetical protein
MSACPGLSPTVRVPPSTERKKWPRSVPSMTSVLFATSDLLPRQEGREGDLPSGPGELCESKVKK